MAAKDFLAGDGASTRMGLSSFMMKGISGFDWRGLNCGLARSPSDDDLGSVVRACRHHCSGPVRITDMQATEAVLATIRFAQPPSAIPSPRSSCPDPLRWRDYRQS